MIYLYFTQFEVPLPPLQKAKALSRLPQYFQNQINAFVRWQDATASLTGKLLLHYASQTHFNGQLSLEALQIDDYKRPFIPNTPDWNISHAGSVVILAVSTEDKVGVDVEHIQPIEIQDFTSVFTDHEIEDMLQATAPYDRFYEYWTLKEAVVKAEGSGLYIPLKELDIQAKVVYLRDRSWQYQRLPLHSEYKCTVAAPQIDAFEVVEVSQKDLLKCL